MAHQGIAFVSEKEQKVENSSRHAWNDLGMERILAYRQEHVSKIQLHCSTEEPVRTKSALKDAGCMVLVFWWSRNQPRLGRAEVYFFLCSPNAGYPGTHEAFASSTIPSDFSASLHDGHIS